MSTTSSPQLTCAYCENNLEKHHFDHAEWFCDSECRKKFSEENGAGKLEFLERAFSKLAKNKTLKGLNVRDIAAVDREDFPISTTSALVNLQRWLGIIEKTADGKETVPLGQLGKRREIPI